MFTLILKFHGIIFSNIEGQAGSEVTKEECEGQDDGWLNSLGLGEDLMHIRYNVPSQVNLLGQASIPRCRLESAQPPSPPQSILVLV